MTVDFTEGKNCRVKLKSRHFTLINTDDPSELTLLRYIHFGETGKVSMSLNKNDDN